MSAIGSAPTIQNDETYATAALDWAKNNKPRLVTFGGAFLLTTGLFTSPPTAYVIKVAGIAIVVGATAWQCYRGPVKAPLASEHKD